MHTTTNCPIHSFSSHICKPVMSLHRYSSTIIKIKDVSTCFYYSLTSATASLQRLIVCYGKGFVMSGVFAASLQGAVWKSRVPQKWFNPNYPVCSVCFRPVSSPLVPSCCNLLSVDIYLQCKICCSGLWNMESASVRNNLFSILETSHRYSDAAPSLHE